MTLAEFAASLERSLTLVRPEIERGLVAFGETAEKLARDAIGHEHAEWPPLAPATIADKSAHNFAVPAPLLRTGELRDSIHFKIDMLDYTVIVGSDNPKAIWHELGTRHIPPRPFLAMAMRLATGDGHSATSPAELIFGAAVRDILVGGAP